MIGALARYLANTATSRLSTDERQLRAFSPARNQDAATTDGRPSTGSARMRGDPSTDRRRHP
ncbi:MAG: hypothetical protein M0C28_18765 [Candidatus Moduliflexus flocculans]|nr:hypothetical protein [Candidatus Moduliflexus flocculans]